METTARRALSELIDQLLVPGADEPVAGLVPAPARPTSPVFQSVEPTPPTPPTQPTTPLDAAPPLEPTPLLAAPPFEPAVPVQTAPAVPSLQPAPAPLLAEALVEVPHLLPEPEAAHAPATPAAPPAQPAPPADDDDLTGLEQFGIQVQPDHPVRPVPVQRAAEPPQVQSVPQAFTVLPGGAKSSIMWRSRHT